MRTHLSNAARWRVLACLVVGILALSSCGDDTSEPVSTEPGDPATTDTTIAPDDDEPGGPPSEEAEVEPDRAMVGTSWEIISTLQGPDAFDTVSDATGAGGSLVLEADGTFEITTPCLVRSGTYVERGDARVVFSITDDQPQPCEEPDDELAAAVDAVLVHGAIVEIDGDDMTMWADDVGLGLRAAEQR